MKICIIGGSGAFGQWYARLFKKNGFGVVINCRHSAAGEKAAKQLGVEFEKSFSKAVSQADWAMVSVPIEATPSALRRTAEHLPRGALLFDMASVKAGARNALQKIAAKRKDLELASIHPMHGPRAESLKGVPVVIVPVRKGAQFSLLKKVFEKQGAAIVESSAAEHDEILSVVQGMTHFVLLASASALGRKGFDVAHGRKFSSPVYKLFSSLMARVALQNPHLYAGIQLENPANKKARKTFLKEAAKLDGLVSSRRRRAVEKWIGKCAGAFKGRLGEELVKESDAALQAVERFEGKKR